MNNLLDICAYANYKIHEEYDYSYIDEENSLPNDIGFKKENDSEDYIMNGGQFLSSLADYLNNDDICGFTIINGVIKIETFNPMNGTGSTRVLTIEGGESND